MELNLDLRYVYESCTGECYVYWSINSRDILRFLGHGFSNIRSSDEREHNAFVQNEFCKNWMHGREWRKSMVFVEQQLLSFIEQLVGLAETHINFTTTN